MVQPRSGRYAQPAITSAPELLFRRLGAVPPPVSASAPVDSATGSPLRTAARKVPAPAASRRPVRSNASAYPESPTWIRCTCRCSSSRSSVEQTVRWGFPDGTQASIAGARSARYVRETTSAPESAFATCSGSSAGGNCAGGVSGVTSLTLPRLGASSETSASRRAASASPPMAMPSARSISRCCAMYAAIRAAACSAMACSASREAFSPRRRTICSPMPASSAMGNSPLSATNAARRIAIRRRVVNSQPPTPAGYRGCSWRL